MIICLSQVIDYCKCIDINYNIDYYIEVQNNKLMRKNYAKNKTKSRRKKEYGSV